VRARRKILFLAFASFMMSPTVAGPLESLQLASQLPLGYTCPMTTVLSWTLGKGAYMPRSNKKRGKVRVTFDFPEAYLDLTFPRDGYALPRHLRATATENPDLPGVTVEVEVEIKEGRARPSSVKVSSDDGVGWTTLSAIPVRDIVGTAVLHALHTVKPEGEGRIAYMPIDQNAPVDEVREIVQAAVRYAPDLDRFDGERVR
jgi:hypothetical protein